jgi:hypothetical protein
LDKLGGREKLFEETETASKTKKRRRATNGGTPSTTASTTKRSRRGDAHPANTTPPATSKPWSPPAGSWEDEIESIELEEDENIGKIIVYLRWKNGKKTKHDTDVVYRKCPQKASTLGLLYDLIEAYANATRYRCFVSTSATLRSIEARTRSLLKELKTRQQTRKEAG